MTDYRFALAIFPILFLLLTTEPAHAAENCDADGQVRFICGPVNAEDLVLLPGSPWVLASSMIDEGELVAVNRFRGRTTSVFPAPEAVNAQDRNTYGDCPGPLDARFRPHGLAVVPGRDGLHTVYVVGHGGREAVEVFSADVTGSQPRLSWRGCVVAPEGVSLNSVTPLPDGGFIATNFNTRSGQLWEWHSDTGWHQVPGSEMAGPNGIVASADGRWLFIGGWSDEAVIRLSRGQNPLQKAVVQVGFHVDNLRWTADGRLLAGGQFGSDMAAIGGCLNGGSCDGVSSRAARIDPESLTVEQLVDYPSNPRFLFSTVALQVGTELWLGGIAGGNRIARFAADQLPYAD